MSERKTAVQTERQGVVVGGGGVLLALIGLAAGQPAALVIGVICAVIGLVMYGASLARGE